MLIILTFIIFTFISIEKIFLQKSKKSIGSIHQHHSLHLQFPHHHRHHHYHYHYRYHPHLRLHCPLLPPRIESPIRMNETIIEINYLFRAVTVMAIPMITPYFRIFLDWRFKTSKVVEVLTFITPGK